MTTAKDISLLEKQNSNLMRRGQKMANYINYIKKAANSNEFEVYLFNMPNREFDLVNAMDWDQLVAAAKEKEGKKI